MCPLLAVTLFPLATFPTLQQAYLKASNTGSADFFGDAVAVSGDTAVVGAFTEASAAAGVGGIQTDNSASGAGAVYVFVRSGSTWTQQAYIKSSNTAAGDNFGASVAISGNTLVVGAPTEDSNSTGVNGSGLNDDSDGSGAAYVFVRTGTVWTQQAYIKASNTGQLDNFGRWVAISGDTLAVSAPLEDSSTTGIGGDQSDNTGSNSGAVYVFTRTSGVWNQQAYVKASNTGGQDEFGRSIALAGDTLVVGAPLEDSSETGIGGSGASNTAADAGAAYVFVRSAGAWSQQAYVKASNAAAGDIFGSCVSVAGQTALVGAPGEDSAATGVGGNQGDESAAGAGAAYAFARSGAVWTQQSYLKASNGGTGDAFGAALALSANALAVGAHSEDSNATGIGGDGANNTATNAGAAYVFVRSGASWANEAYLKASNTDAGDAFGGAVAIGEATVLVGARNEASNATGVGGNQANDSLIWAGAAYAFALSPPAPVPYCFGDGSGAPCPCSPAPVPHGAAGKGCPTNVFPGGAVASASGAASLSADTLVLLGSEMVSGSNTFFQGATQQSGGAGAAFGDGLRCIQSSGIRRFRTKAVVSNATSYPQAGDPLVSVAGAVAGPGTLHYQGWYRSANPSFCTAATFNLTNGLGVTWGP